MPASPWHLRVDGSYARVSDHALQWQIKPHGDGRATLVLLPCLELPPFKLAECESVEEAMIFSACLEEGPDVLDEKADILVDAGYYEDPPFDLDARERVGRQITGKPEGARSLGSRSWMKRRGSDVYVALDTSSTLTCPVYICRLHGDRVLPGTILGRASRLVAKGRLQNFRPGVDGHPRDEIYYRPFPLYNEPERYVAALVKVLDRRLSVNGDASQPLHGHQHLEIVDEMIAVSMTEPSRPGV